MRILTLTFYSFTHLYRGDNVCQRRRELASCRREHQQMWLKTQARKERDGEFINLEQVILQRGFLSCGEMVLHSFLKLLGLINMTEICELETDLQLMNGSMAHRQSGGSLSCYMAGAAPVSSGVARLTHPSLLPPSINASLHPSIYPSIPPFSVLLSAP